MDSSLVINQLPEEWKNLQFGDICTRVSDSYSPMEGGNATYLGLEHLTQGFPSLVGYGSESNVRSSKMAFKKGDILFGKLRPYLRKAIYAEFDGICSTDILVFRVNSRTDPQFLTYIVHTDQFVDHAKSTTTGVQHPRTSWSSLKKFRLSIPPLPEQKKIAYILSTVQRAIEQQERIIATTTDLKKALMHKLFTEGLCGEPQKETEIGLVPESWDVMQFEEFATLQRGKDLTRSNFNYGLIPVAGSNGIIGYHDTPNVVGPGVVVGRSGSVGKVTFYQQNFWAHNTVLYVKDFHNNEPKFVYYKLQSLDLTQYKAGVAVPTLNRNTFRTTIIAAPPLKEQQEIVNVLDATQKKIDIVQDKKRTLQDLFKSLLHQLMTAQIRVNDIDLGELENLEAA